MFTLKNKILSPKQIQYDVYHSKVRLFSICTLLLLVVYVNCYGMLKAPPINGLLWVHVLVYLPITALIVGGGVKHSNNHSPNIITYHLQYISPLYDGRNATVIL